MTDPEEHIYQHFPNDPRWQLLKTPITLDEFIHLPVVKSPFFNTGLSFCVKTDSILKATNGAVDLRLLAPKLVNFAMKLRCRDSRDSRAIPEDALKDRHFVRTIDNQIIFVTNLPAPGRYYWDIFVDSDWTSSLMDNACSFQIHCSTVPAINKGISYPQVGCFGRTPNCAGYGITEDTDYDPYIVASGELAIALKISTDDVRLTHSMQFWNQRDQTPVDCDRFALLRSFIGSRPTYIVRCPRQGFYILSISAASSSSSSKPHCVYRYLIECRSPVKNAHPMARTSSRWRHCRLVEPLDGELMAKSKVVLRVESKMAQEMMVSVGGQWVTMVCAQNLWSATVSTGEVAGKLGIYGRFDAASEKCVPLVEYTIKEATLTDEVRTLFKYL